MDKNGIYFNESGWGYVAKEVDLKTYQIKYKEKSGFASFQDAETAQEKDQKIFFQSMEKIKKATGMKYTFSSYLTYWYKENLQAYAFGSYQATCAWVIFDMILPSLEEDVMLKYVTPSYIQKLIDHVAPICKSAAYMAYKVLSIAMKDAVTEGLLAKTPMEHLSIPKRNVPKVIVYSKDQIKQLLTAAKEYHYGSIYLEVLLAMFLGLRTGEILGLRFDDFDFTEKTVDIKRQYTRNIKVISEEDGSYKMESSGSTFKPPKSYCSYRCLRVPEFVLEEVRKRNNLNHINAKERPGFSSDYLDYLCLGPKGTIKNYNTCLNALSVICQKNNLEKAGLHTLRHVFATIMLEQGVPLEKLSKMMGHKNVGTTLDIYCGIIQGKDDIRDYVENHLDPVMAAEVV